MQVFQSNKSDAKYMHKATDTPQAPCYTDLQAGASVWVNRLGPAELAEKIRDFSAKIRGKRTQQIREHLDHEAAPFRRPYRPAGRHRQLCTPGALQHIE